MNMQQWKQNQLASATKKAMPILSFPSVTLMGISVRELISDSAKQAKGMKLIADRCDTAASVSMMDLSVEAEAFGAQVVFSDDEVPTVTGILLKSPEDAEALKVPAVGTGRTGLYIEAIRQAAGLITDRPVFAGVIGPFSLSGRLMDMSEIMVNCYVEPDMVHTTLKKATAFIIEYIKAYKAAGAHGVVIAEPAAGLLSPDLCEQFSSVYVKQIRDAVADDGFLFIYHNCGNTVPQMTSLLSFKADGYHFGDAINIEDNLKQMPADVPVYGNISPSKVFRSGTPEIVKKATLDLMAQCTKYPNFIISSGCDLPPLTPWDNIDAFFAAVKEFYKQA